MEILAAVAMLTPIVLLFVLATAVTVHYFWLAHAGRWPPNLMAPAPGGRVPGPRPARRKPSAGGVR